MKKKVLKRLLIYVKPYWGFLFGILLSALINISLTLYTPILIGQAVDHIIGFQNVDHQGMIGILIALTLIILFSALFQWVLSHCTNQAAYRTVRDLRVDAYRKINTLPLKYIDGHSHGDVISRIGNDVEQVSEGLLQGITQFFTGIVTIIGTLIFMFTISPIIMLVVVLVTPLSLFVASFIAKFSHKMFVQQQAAQGELSGYMEELISNQKIVKTFQYEKRAQERFEEINYRLQKVGAKAQFLSSLSNPSTRFVNGIVYAAVAIFGSLCAITGWPTVLTIGQISSFLTYANQYTKPFNETTGVITQIQTAFASAERLFEFLDEEEETENMEDAVVMGDCEGNVEIRDVSFSYEPGTTLLEHMNVSAKKGDRIAIVGPTGCGKTTIINLLMRFYDVKSGQITIDGGDIRTMTKASLRGLYGMVLQDTWLFAGTIRENIMYGKPDATEEELIQAAKSAYADAFIQRLPNGYDTVIAEDGGNLSQGQRKLLSIARVMLVDPPMLILDEATSSLDTRTELKVQAAFQNMMEGRTSFIVAHRLSTIKEATTILVMEKGRIVEQGTHQELLQKGGFYANLYNSQFAATE